MLKQLHTRYNVEDIPFLFGQIFNVNQLVANLNTGVSTMRARFIKPSELARWARTGHLHIDDITGLSYNPLTGRYWLGSDVDVNYMAHAQR